MSRIHRWQAKPWNTTEVTNDQVLCTCEIFQCCAVKAMGGVSKQALETRPYGYLTVETIAPLPTDSTLGAIAVNFGGAE